ncbi:hypothetical protein [Paenibacillus swuensis]|nr:hypothetical protein [Paenibacillus swuensis]
MEQLETMTMALVHQIEHSTEEDIVAFVQQREEHIDLLKNGTVNQAQLQEMRDQLSKLLAYDEIILGRMNEFKISAELGMHKTSTARKQKSAYESTILYDSLLFDTKK